MIKEEYPVIENTNKITKTCQLEVTPQRFFNFSIFKKYAAKIQHDSSCRKFIQVEFKIMSRNLDGGFNFFYLSKL